MITIDDKLEALSETERGALCSHTYQKLRAKGLDVDLATIMVTISKVTIVWCLVTVLCLARTAVSPGHDDGRGEGGHQEAGDVLQSTTEGGLPSESDGEGDTDVVALDDKIQVHTRSTLS